VVTEVSIEHMPVSLAPSGDLSSAPRDFTVWVSVNASLTVTVASKSVTERCCRNVTLILFAESCDFLCFFAMDVRQSE